MPLGAIGLGIGAVGAIGGLFSGLSANKKLGSLIGQDPTYTANPLAAQRLALAQNLLNARMPGATFEQQNIQGATANQNANVQKNATSGAQAIAAESANQGNENQQFANLGNQEAQNYQQRFQNLGEAQQGEISEQEKAFQSQVRQFQDKAQIYGAQAANTRGMWGSLSNLGFGLANFGAAGGNLGIGGKVAAPPPAFNPYSVSPQSQGAMAYNPGGYAYNPGYIDPNSYSQFQFPQ